MKIIGSATLTALSVLVFFTGLADATSKPSPHGEFTQIEAYSKHPSGTEPYRACPPPKGKRLSCFAVVDPRGVTGRGDRGGKHFARGHAEEGGSAAVPTFCNGCGSGLENGFSPQDLQSIYQLPSLTKGTGQTVAIVDAYDDPNAEADLAVYRETYDLPPCTTANGCFSKVDQTGGHNLPPAEYEWGLEISLDVDMVSAACPNCHILLVEANDNTVENLAKAVQTAADLGATQISNSYGSREKDVGQKEIELFDNYYNQPGIAVTVASGDDGYNNEQFATHKISTGECLNCSPSYPSDLSSVISVGGTTIYPEGTSGRGWKEYVWPYSGSGCSLYITKPSWQKDPGCAKRTENDVAAVAGGETNLSVYDTFGRFYHGWIDVAGTSASTPLVAAGIALESSSLQSEGIAGIYNHPENWFDISEGSNWWGLDEQHTLTECSNAKLCVAKSGYDGPTGMGTPNGGTTVTPPSAVALPAREVTTTTAVLRGAVNPERSTTTYRFQYGKTTSYGAETPQGGGSVSGYTTVSTKTAEIGQLTPGTKYHYRMVATSAAGTTYSGDRVFSTGPMNHHVNFGSQGSLSAPEETAIDPSGNIWVADTGNNRIEKFSANGTFLKACGQKGTTTPGYEGTDIRFVEPAGIAIEPTYGWLYISDRGNNRIQVLYADCEFITSFGTKGSGVGQLSEPTGLTISQAPSVFASEGPAELLVADTGNNRVEIFNALGSFEQIGEVLTSFGSKGTGTGQFERPTDVLSDITEPRTYYVVDSGNGRVEKIKTTWDSKTSTLSASYVSQFGSKGSGAGQLSNPTAGTIDPTTGDIAITDTGNNRVSEFLPTGSYTSSFGSAGSGDSEFSSPRGLIASPSGKLFVADKSNSRISVWRPSSSAQTNAATGIEAHEVKLEGEVNPQGLSTSYWFEYGTTAGYYESKLPSSPESLGSGTSPIAVGKELEGLKPNTTYHYRVVSSSTEGTTFGQDETFTTYALPVASYSFDRGSGSKLVDETVGSHDGTITGATWASEGKYGSALDFNGSSDYVSIADSDDLDLTGGFTIEAWVRPDTLAGMEPVVSKAESVGASGYRLTAGNGNSHPE